MLHPNLGLDQVYVEHAADGLLCKLGGFLSEENTNKCQQAKWKHGQVSSLAIWVLYHSFKEMHY